MYRTRIVVAESDRDFRVRLKEILRHAGYMVIGETQDGRSLLQIVFQTTPELVILEYRLPGSEGIDVAGIIEEHHVAPVVLTADLHQQNVAELVRSPGVYGVLPRPLQEEMVVPTIEMALASFERTMRLEKEIRGLRKALEERKLTERAKGLLMERKGMTERQAYKYLQKLSMNRCVPLARVAREVIMALEK
ncbi:ANTAR domain-containing response regulator [Desulfofundulus thermosubterraneus]|uniref:Stage 0 sporulation protein A homolog n=1 Tax=Desulfofundulus thermosubterraneus DSM 16057 TaxID=1121432 RepID=A0A1M6JK76_9FIRM|nr:ANTAR domain-containing protein [Desulfofundulus thermosubterraneus]SHJ47054.1 response regulator receiver and ANTAR domain protein [Desulfofundulus thermosubterraneus DSM 16057]